jgi:hypothetical protein
MGTAVALVPRSFPPGSDRTAVERELAAARFERLDRRDPFVANLAPDRSDRLYRREIRGPVCLLAFYGVATFDDSDTLVRADVRHLENGCL